MNLGARFNTIACLTVLFGLLMFCLADDRPGLAVLSIAVSALGWFAGGARGGWQPIVLPRVLVNLLVLGTIINAAFRASHATVGQPIVSHLGEFLVYVQLLKLFDRRTSRDESQLLTLSLFVVIAAMLTSNTLPVGLCLVVYTPLAVTTAMLYQLRAGQRRASGLRPIGTPVDPDQPVPSAAVIHGRRPGVQFRRITLISLLGAGALAAGIFVITPRGLGAGSLGKFGEGKGGSMQTGFNERIELGQRGYLGDNTEPVLDLAVEDTAGANIGSPDRVYYLRGVTRNRYQDSIWTSSRSETLSVQVDTAEPAPLDSEGRDASHTTRVVQRVTLRNPRGQNPVLFTIWRPLSVSADQAATLDVTRSDLSVRRNGSAPSDLTYTIVSSLTDGDTGRTPRRPTAFAKGPIHDLAASILEKARIPLEPERRDRPANRQAASAIREHLQANFSYSRELVAPEPDQDPIEMFLFQTKRGHCEYFASAMVALCQSVGIPARLVVGYVAADYNGVTGKYLVRQSNAHAWAEVYIGAEGEANGSWQSLDPSPPDDVAAIHRSERGWMAAIRHWYETIEFGWNRSIIGFDATHQRSSAVGRRLNFEAVDRFFDDVAGRLFVAAKTVGKPDGLSIWTAWVLPTIVVVSVIAVVFGRRRVGMGMNSGRRRAASRRRSVASTMVDGGSYLRALKALSRAGAAKPEAVPPLAHARTLRTSRPAAEGPFAAIAGLYYKARFGGLELSPSEQQAAATESASLRRALARPRPRK